MNVGQAQIHHVTRTVWSTVLGLTIEPKKTAPQAPERFMIGQVVISGAWHGAVSLACSLDLAYLVAGSMFSLPPVEATVEEVRDAVGELTNMVGGNIKSLIKGDCRLSVPAVVDVVGHGRTAPGARVAEELWFSCNGGTVLVCLIPT